MASGLDISLTSNCSGQGRKLQGSFLIQFSGCTIKLNNEEYANSNTDVSPKLYLPTTGLTVIPSKVINKMPLQYLQDFNLEHRSNIEHLNLTTNNIHWKLHLFTWLSFGSISTITLWLLAVFGAKTVLPCLSRTSTHFRLQGRPNNRNTVTEDPTELATSRPTQDENSIHINMQPRYISQPTG